GKNKGKGEAIIAGAKAAKNQVLVFVDADFKNITWEIIDKLAFPVMANQAKLCKAKFGRSAGRVTELTAKPLLEFFFPEVKLQQPLSGQFAARKDFLLGLDISNDWGIDIGIVLESARLGEKIIEVDIGELEHKHRTLEQLGETARQVTKTILQNAGFFAKKHKIIIFDFDKTLVAQSSIELIAREFGFRKGFEIEREKFRSGKITERQLSKKIAVMLKGKSIAKLKKTAAKTKKQPFAQETLVYLKRMGYKLAIVSFAFHDAITGIFDEALFDKIICPELESEEGTFTGRVNIPPYNSKKHVFSKGKAVASLLSEMGILKEEAIAVGDSASDEEMFKEVAIPVSINSGKISPIALRIKALPELIIIAS
ncbi:MAG: HAD-IB family phosphatase, partial [Candidatus Diapherotrites archaeon]